MNKGVLSQMFIKLEVPFPLDSQELDVAKSTPMILRIDNNVTRWQLTVVNRCYAYICYLSFDSRHTSSTTKFRLNFGYVHTNGTIIFPHDEPGNLHEITSPGGLYMERMLRIPTDSIENFKIKKTIVCQVQFQHALSEPQHSLDANVTQTYQELFSEQLLTDCVIKCRDGEEIKAHKFMLAAHSSVMHEELQRGDVNKAEVSMESVERKVAYEMMRFLYCRKINGFDGISVELFRLAHEYKIDDLKKLCEEQIMRRVSIATSVELVILAYAYNAKLLKKFTLGFICEHWNAIKESANVGALYEHPRILYDIISEFASQQKTKSFYF